MPWSLSLPDRVLLVATYLRTNLSTRQIPPLFELSQAVARHAINSLRPYWHWRQLAHVE